MVRQRVRIFLRSTFASFAGTFPSDSFPDALMLKRKTITLLFASLLAASREAKRSVMGFRLSISASGNESLGKVPAKDAKVDRKNIRTLCRTITIRRALHPP